MYLLSYRESPHGTSVNSTYSFYKQLLIKKQDSSQQDKLDRGMPNHSSSDAIRNENGAAALEK